MTGAAFGNSNTDTSGAYCAIASYLNTGPSTIETISNDVYIAAPGNWAKTTRNGQAAAAPLGPFKMCISSTVESDGSCSTTGARFYPPNAYKFSIYGYTWEDANSGAWATRYAAMPAGTAYIGVRIRYSAHNFVASKVCVCVSSSPTHPPLCTFSMETHPDPTVTPPLLLKVYFNGDTTVTLDNVGITDITSMSLVISGDNVLHYSFPPTYNRGVLNPGLDASGIVKSEQPRPMKIHAAKVPGSASSFWIEYSFRGSNPRLATRAMLPAPWAPPYSACSDKSMV